MRNARGVRAAFAVALLLSFLVRGAAAAPEPSSTASANVLLGDVTVFSLVEGDTGRSASERARLASQRLAEAVARPSAGNVRWEQHGDDAVVLLGITPFVTLHPRDAELAHEPSLAALAQRVVASVQAAVERERERAAVAQGVFSGSLVVFSALVCMYLGRRLSLACAGGRRYLTERGRDMPGLRLKGLEVMGPVALRSALLLLLGVARWLGLIGLAYAWLVVSLSMFEGTRPYVEQLTGLVLAPLSSLAGRVAAALPVFAVVSIAGLLVLVLARTMESFFASVARGEVELDWLSPTAAPALSVLSRGALVLAAAVFVGPVLTGDQEGPLSRTAFVAVLAVGLASVPLLSSVLMGLVLALSHALRVGDRVEYGGRAGVVRSVDAFALCLEDEAGAELRVPHVMALWHPTRVLRREQP
jgi:Mechanosensitive ion channel